MILRVVFILFTIVASNLLLQAQGEYLNAIEDEEKASIASYLQSRYWGNEKSNLVYSKKLNSEQQQAHAVILQKEMLKEFFRNSRNFLRSINSEHTVIKILDQKGLDENLIFLFEEIQSEHAINLSAIKIIKKDGTHEVIDIDKKAVIIQSGKVIKKRLVIPNLEIGDIIDYYTYLEFRVLFPEQYSRTYDPVYILPQNGYPILEYNLVFSLGPSAFMNVSANEIPNFNKVSFKVNKRTFTRFSLHLKNLESYPKDIPWFYPFQALPNLKYQIFIGPYYGNTDVKYNLGGALKMNKNIQPAKLQDYMIDVIETNTYKKFYKGFKSHLKLIGKNARQLDKKELVDELYYYYQRKKEIERLKSGEKINNDSYQFVRRFHYVFRKLKIDHDILVAFDRKFSNIKSFVLVDEIELLIRINLDKPYFLANPSSFSEPNVLPVQFQNIEAYVFNPTTLRLTKEQVFGSNKVVNASYIDVSIKLINNNQDAMINRTFVIEGYSKKRFQRIYGSIAGNLFSEDSEWIGFKKKELDQLKSKVLKLNTKKGEDAIESTTSEVEKNLNHSINDSYGFDAMSFDIYPNNERKFVFQDSFIVEEFADVTQSDLLVNIGAFAFSKTKLADSRNYAIYFDYPERESYTIRFKVPDDFILDEIDHLNKKVINAVGVFESKASMEGDTLIIDINKDIKHYFLESTSWDEIKALFDTLSEFRQQSILLRAKQ